VAEKEEAGVVTAAMGKAVAVEVMLTVEGVGVVVVVDIEAAVREEAVVEVMVAAEGMVIVEVEETSGIPHRKTPQIR
jgi:hypothetical protein